MPLEDDFRFKAHELLVELDASVTKMMMMVSAKEISGDFWDEATSRHQEASLAWCAFISSTEAYSAAEDIRH
ncbi:hypothetical protein L6218_12005 [Pseudomonas syringae pv. syringae]|uniref:hypothetical protein n=1 Tax=Pseudomonas TaxID=286 RepID=UPI0006B8BEDC|nr:hypothetical protein [Pseudomonas syringae]MCF5550380.1 hypothetical protein [Pseudomonas syringae]MCH5498807.1 hypothetical protein [Pseudomonas syringae pv. syringae]MCH5525166.1 hypothetical protein [Pseudomonas syringae pv. syringae]MCH5560182.1 hypothetical protein [Pseudomonas syringae pv. syringae]MCH5565343.1 hypothetical protein [Pseudomonas syringae pv. syringae]